MTDAQLITVATALAGAFQPSADCSAGGVAAALLAVNGQIYTGICVDTHCSLGFCAEHAAVAEMLKARQSEIRAIVAVTDEGKILAPCGRCRELMLQVNPRNKFSRIILGANLSATLQELLPQIS